MNLGGLAGLSGAYGGYQEAEANDLQNRLRAQALAQQAYDLAQQQGGDVGMGQYIRGGAQGLGGLGGVPPMGGGGMPPQQQQPMGGAPSPAAPPPAGGQLASAAPPPGGGAIAPFASRFSPMRGPMPGGRPMMPALQQRYPGAQSAGALPPAGPPAPQQMPFTPQQQPMGGPPPQGPQQQSGGGQQQMPIGMMDIRQVLMGLARANPNAPPQVLAAAAKNLIPLLNVGNHAAMAEASLMLKAMGLENSMLRTGALYGVGPYGDVFGDVTKNKAERGGEMQTARTQAVRETNLKMILQAAGAAMPAAIEQSNKVASGRTGFVPLNKIIQGGMIMTSDPELRAFGMANLQLAEHWARAMNPTGVMRESDRDLALHFLSTADTQKTYQRLVQQLGKQIKREYDAIHSGQAGFDSAQAAMADLAGGGSGDGEQGNAKSNTTSQGVTWSIE